MSQENGEVVHKPLRVREGSGRTFEQRLGLRFPMVAAMSARLLGRLPPGSRLRQAVVQRTTRFGVEAWNRRDLDAFLIGYRADFEIHQPRELVEAGLVDSCYRGAEGYRKSMEACSKYGAPICGWNQCDSSTRGRESRSSTTLRCGAGPAVSP